MYLHTYYGQIKIECVQFQLPNFLEIRDMFLLIYFVLYVSAGARPKRIWSPNMLCQVTFAMQNFSILYLKDV